MDANEFRPASHIDPVYSEELKRAKANGVKIMVYDVDIDTEGISLNCRLPYRLKKKPLSFLTQGEKG
jgi:DNA-binding sugar fermentation-stimulating protein